MFARNHTVKNKDGSTRTYLQICQSERVNGKPRPTVLMNLGRVDTPEGKEFVGDLAKILIESTGLFSFLDLNKDITTEWTKNLGFNFVFSHLWNVSGLKNIVNNATNDLETEYNVSDVLYNMILNRLHDPSSKRRLPCWQEKIYGINQYQEQHYYRTLDHLIAHKEDIEKNLFLNQIQSHKESVDIALFDTTTLVYYGEGDKGEDLLACGFSKARRGDLKQVVIGVIMSGEGIPLGYEVFSGNTNDVTCFKSIIDKIKTKFNLRKLILVGDRGMISKKNIEHLHEAGYEYILGYRMRTIPKEDRSAILSKADFKIIKKDSLHFKEVNYNEQRLLVCYNPERAILDKEKREEILNRLGEKIKGATIKSIVTNPEYKKFLKIHGDDPEIDLEKVAQDELYDGVFVLTSNTKLSGRTIIERYKDLWQIEAGFRCLKDELEAGPIYHWKDRRIRAHIMVCFFALILRIELNKKLKEFDNEISFSDVMSNLEDLDAVSLTLKSSHVITRTELKSGAKIAFSALDLKVPEKTLAISASQKILL